MKVKATLLIVVAAVFVAHGIAASRIMNQFKWLPTECAPADFPMQLVDGTFKLADGSIQAIPLSSLISNGWGEHGSTHVVGLEMKPVPIELELSWFSYAENKFFRGEFKLFPEPIEALLRQRLIDASGEEQPAYNRILVGVAPEGFVAVWARGTYVTTEIATYRARETLMDWKVINDNPQVQRKDYVDLVLVDTVSAEALEKLHAKGVPPGRWEKLHIRFDVTLSVRGGAKVKELGLWSVNGERERYFSPTPDAYPVKKRAVPAKVRVRWTGVSLRKVGMEVAFDMDEVLGAFRRLQPESPTTPLALQVELMAADDTVRVSVAGARSVVYLRPISVKSIEP